MAVSNALSRSHPLSVHTRTLYVLWTKKLIKINLIIRLDFTIILDFIMGTHIYVFLSHCSRWYKRWRGNWKVSVRANIFSCRLLRCWKQVYFCSGPTAPPSTVAFGLNTPIVDPMFFAFNIITHSGQCCSCLASVAPRECSRRRVRIFYLPSPVRKLPWWYSGCRSAGTHYYFLRLIKWMGHFKDTGKQS